MKSLDLRTLLHDAAADVLRETVIAWLGPDAASAPAGGKSPSRAALVGSLSAAMEDEATVLRRLQQLPRKLQDLLEPFLQAPGSVISVQQLFSTQGQAFKSRFDLEACLAALQREGMLFPANDKRWTDYQAQGYAVPAELARCVIDHRARARSALKDLITLQGFLDARHFRARNQKATKAGKNGKPVEGADEKAAQDAREQTCLHRRAADVRDAEAERDRHEEDDETGDDVAQQIWCVGGGGWGGCHEHRYESGRAQRRQSLPVRSRPGLEDCPAAGKRQPRGNEESRRPWLRVDDGRLLRYRASLDNRHRSSRRRPHPATLSQWFLHIMKGARPARATDAGAANSSPAATDPLLVPGRLGSATHAVQL